jgi:hypothetical protein
MPKESSFSDNAGREWLESHGPQEDESRVVFDPAEVELNSPSETPDEDTMIEELDRKRILEEITKRLSPAQMEFLVDITVSPENFDVSDLSDVDKLRYTAILKRLQVIFKNTSFQKDYFEKKSVSAVVPEKSKSKFPDETIFSRNDLDALAALLS